MSKAAKPLVIANWSASLDADCPKCLEHVDLLTADDFWDGRAGLQIGEHDTERTNALDVVCPECSHEFEVTCVW